MAMGNPIVPTPMNPILVITLLLSNAAGVRLGRGETRCRGFDSPPSRSRPRRLVYYPHMLLGLALIGAAAISWGTTGATMALLSRDTGISPLFVGWARLAIA